MNGLPPGGGDGLSAVIDAVVEPDECGNLQYCSVSCKDIEATVVGPPYIVPFVKNKFPEQIKFVANWHCSLQSGKLSKCSDMNKQKIFPTKLLMQPIRAANYSLILHQYQSCDHRVIVLEYIYH